MRTRHSDDAVVLREPRETDRDDRLAIGRHAEFVLLVGGDDRDLATLTGEEVDAWYRDVAADPLCWVIEVEGRAIGTARLRLVDQANRKARYSIGIFDPAMWGRGYGTKATRLVVGYGFDVVGLHRIELRVLADNHRAIRSYESCGFVREGVHREIEFVAGRWLSDLYMSILEDEYRSGDRFGTDQRAHQ